MNMLHGLLLVSLLALTTSCGRQDTAPARSVIPPGLARPFTEDLEPVRQLRPWVSDALPAGTVILDYRREHAWDGTVAEFWILDCPGGFASLTKLTNARTGVQVTADAAYKVLQNDLRRLGVTLGGDRPLKVWSLEWKTTADKTSVRGTIYPHTGGETLRIERITLD
jgi:hypothetical protein